MDVNAPPMENVPQDCAIMAAVNHHALPHMPMEHSPMDATAK